MRVAHHRSNTRARRPLRTRFVLLAAICAVCCGQLPADSQPGRPVAPEDSRGAARGQGEKMPQSADWQEVDRLISEQKMQQAAELVAEIRQQSRAAGNERETTRALIREVQLQTALHGYETAVRFLKSEEWPADPRAQLLLGLFYGESLRTYHQSYSWEIRQRERVVSRDEVDLKAWTSDQLREEILDAYASAWQQRQEWGAESLGDLAEYLDQNDYPARIRGTLRDTTTYLWVQLLADRSLWTAQQSNELHRLRLDDLLAPAEAAESIDPQAHPLTSIRQLLADLEAWHLAHRRPEAALEARLELLRQLQSALTQPADRLRLREHLEKRLETVPRGLEWWSMGMAELATLVQGETDSLDHLVRAHRIAREGADAHPNSAGGQRCRHLGVAIERPSYSVQSMATDSAGKRSVQITHANLKQVHFRAYPFDLAARLASGTGRLQPNHRQLEALLARTEPVAAWTVDLPPTPDFQSHLTYTTPPVAKLGSYVLVSSVRRDFAEAGNFRSAVSFVVTDLVLSSRREGGDSKAYEATVRSGTTGEALPEVELTLHRLDYRKGHRLVTRQATDAAGRARFDTEGWQRSQHVLAARLGDDQVVDVGSLGKIYVGKPRPHISTLVYTDRSAYRPGQEILWKIVTYQTDEADNQYRTLEGHQATVELVDANGESVSQQDVVSSEYGSASGRFDIPAGRLLGNWRINISTGGSSSVRVEEYKRPTFQVEMLDAEDALRLNREARLAGEARYYFGLPVTAGQVSWRVTRQPVYPRWWWRPISSAAEQPIADGASSLDADGRFEIHFTPEADERLAATKAGRAISYNYQLSAEVTDEGGETRTASKSFRIGFTAIEAELQPAAEFFDTDQSIEWQLLRRDLAGLPRAGDAEYRIVRLKMPTAPQLPADLPVDLPVDEQKQGYRTPGDDLRPRWQPGLEADRVLRLWSDGREVAAGGLTHDAQGLAQLDLRLPAGAYRLHYLTKDEFGAVAEQAQEFLVSGDDFGPALSALLMVEKDAVEVGETLTLWVHSGFSDQQLTLEVYRGAERSLERRLIGGPHMIEVPVTEADRGGITVALSGVRDHQLMSSRRQIEVPWTDRQLKVEMASFRDLMRPGGSETWTMTVRAADGKPVGAAAAEVLAYMYDRSLEVFGPHQPPRPLEIYPRRGQPPLERTTLGQGRRLWQRVRGFAEVPGFPSFRQDRLKFLDGYGVGGPGGRMQVAFMRDAPKRMARKSRAPASPMASPAGDAEMVMAESAPMAQALAADDASAGNAEPPPPESSDAGELRTDFAETAFWFPHLLSDADGAVSFEFTVPDSVTEWQIWAHALTRDFRAGRLQQTARSAKELLVRPYLPRFFREGDELELRVAVDNSGEQPLAGQLDFDLIDPETEQSRLADFGLSAQQVRGMTFEVEPGRGTTLSVPLVVPRDPGTVAVRVFARAGDLGDGELRPLPILPSRLHLSQSRFVTLNDADRRELSFADMTQDDPTRVNDSLIVTLDGQLFYNVLQSLPYLVEYPYNCTEQTLNRFVSTGILSSLFERYPAVAEMAAQMAERETLLEQWDDDDPNRRMLLEETPWLRNARGGPEIDEGLIRVLDPRIAEAQRTSALAELAKAQTASGGFPWWPGGPPSPYITLYLLQGLSRALEFGVEVPQDLVVRAWQYIRQHYEDELEQRLSDTEDCCWQQVTFLQYVLSNYPDLSWTGGVFTADDTQRMRDFSFRHWRQHSPLLKGYLALVLQRAERSGGHSEEARLVWDSVMDSAKTTQDEGTFWAPEDRSWLWYNDTIETHAFALRVLAELSPDDERRHGLVQWLLLNKKLNHWKSTRATAEVIYSLAHFLDREGTLAAREEASVTVGKVERQFVFEPDRYTGKNNQLVIEGDDIDAKTMSTVVVEKETPGFLFASATWHFSTETLPAEARGDFFRVERTFFKRVHQGGEWRLEPLREGARLEVGDQLEVQLSLRSKHQAEYVHLRDPRGAGFEPEETQSGYRWDLGLGYYQEIRDSATSFFFEYLPVGEYTFKYRVRATVAGEFRTGPAQVQSMYAPEFVAYSAGARLAIAPSD